MSGRERNTIPSFKLNLDRNLPEINRDIFCDSPRKRIIDRSFNNVRYSANTKLENVRTSYNSQVSSAQSQRFQDLFYRNDWPSLSDTETDSPDFFEQDMESDSSASSMFSWADMEGSRRVCEEWEKIQRTLYDEDGPKVTQQHLIDECNQWKTIFPHLRIIGRSFSLQSKNYSGDDSHDTEEEILAENYYSDDQENMSYISKVLNDRKQTLNEKSKDYFFEKKPKAKSGNVLSLFEDLDNLLHISPISQSPLENGGGKKHNAPSLMKSEMVSSRWRHRNGYSPNFVSLPIQSTIESNMTTRDSSAASLYDTKFINRLSGNIFGGFIKYNDNSKKYSIDNSHTLEPIELTVKKSAITNSHDLRSSTAKNRNVSLPPINSNDNKIRRKNNPDFNNPISSKTSRQNKKMLAPLDKIYSTVPKHNIKIDVDALNLFENKSAISKPKRYKRK